jgi:hypothetical protein
MHDQLTELLKVAGFSDHEAAGAGAGSPNSSSAAGQESPSTQAIEQATLAIANLQQVTQGSVDSITANTSALTQAPSQSSSGGGLAGAADAASGLIGGGSSLGGGLLGGGLSLLFDGIKSLFGGGSSEPPPLTTYVPPAAQNFELASSNGVTGDAVYDANGRPRESDVAQAAIGNVQSGGTGGASGSSKGSGTGQGSSNGSQQVTVQVQAMDSQSFLDRSGDIASAVRKAMLNMHSINDVIGDL